MDCSFSYHGFALLIKSADYFVNGAAGIAKRFNIPKTIVGLTLVAFGTSVPELTVSILSATQNNPDFWSLGQPPPTTFKAGRYLFIM